MRDTCVWITTTFEGLHRWKDAPPEVEFLRDWHRHLFHVKLGVKVEGLNRELEFITLKKQVDAFIAARWLGEKFELSCEQLAHKLMDVFKASFVSVSEDDENGAIVTDVIDK